MKRSRNVKDVTIKDVADLAGVSLMTVSRTLRDPDVVAEKTRKLVQQAVDQLNYIPDLSAGSLSSRKSHMIAVILPSLYFEGHMRTVGALSEELRKDGYHLLIGDNYYSREEEMNLLRIILGRRPAGIVMINSAHSDEGRNLLSRSGVPVIETWDLPVKPIDSVVGFSHARVGFALTKHLVVAGYSRIAFVGGPPMSDPRGEERRKGFVDAMELYKLDSTRQIIVEQNHLDIEAGTQAFSVLRERFPDTDAVICLTDRVAMGMMMECRRNNIDVPGKLAITGHGGFDYSEYLVPSLTTTRVDADEIGRQAARIIIKRIENKKISKADRQVDVGFDIVPRDSTAAR